MSAPKLRLPREDPRTIARDIPGLLDALFPNLVSGVVASLNRRSTIEASCEPMLLSEIQETTVARAMLFELSSAVAEQLLETDEQVNWDIALTVAVQRQRRHFDAKIPSSLGKADKKVAFRVARNLVNILASLRHKVGHDEIVIRPPIPGCQWISSGVGDFSVASYLIEVKCTNKNFSSGDYRQVLMYWLLNYLSALEGRATEWSHLVLVNPRHGRLLIHCSDELVHLLGGGRTKVELAELFSSILEDHSIGA